LKTLRRYWTGDTAKSNRKELTKNIQRKWTEFNSAPEREKLQNKREGERYKDGVERAVQPFGNLAFRETDVQLSKKNPLDKFEGNQRGTGP